MVRSTRASHDIGNYAIPWPSTLNPHVMPENAILSVNAQYLK